MRIPWSISTTVRNPERIRNFLRILSEMEGCVWTSENQKKFQISLIQHKVYGYGSKQFLNSLSPEHLELMNNPDLISYQQAQDILEGKNYVGGGAMRGRQSFNPIEKMGFAFLDEDNKIKISSFGRYFLQEDYDLGDTFFKSFLKWQLPNYFSDDFKASDGYSIKPFVATLHLIKNVNKLWSDLGNSPVGVNKQEFAIFIPTLINSAAINETAQKIIEFRNAKHLAADQILFVKEYHYNYISEFLESDDPSLIKKVIDNTIEYADNIVRYFRLTRYLYVRGNGFYIDLEPRRMIEIDSILNSDDASPAVFASIEDYVVYLADVNQPVLAWETDQELRAVTNSLVDDITSFIEGLRGKGVTVPCFEMKDISTLDSNLLKKYVEELRYYRRKLQDIDVHFESQAIDKIREYIEDLRNIHKSSNKKSIELERLATLAINSLNDAIEIKPNYPVGDDNEPTFTAPAGKPDIECFYESFNSVCEVTMLTDRSQWYNEGQPVMRHVRDFEQNNPSKDVYCIFVAPRLHQDTIETFWMAIKHGYRGINQKIVPLSITQIIKILEILVSLKESGRQLNHSELAILYENIIALTNDVTDSAEWVERIPDVVNSWGDRVLEQ